MERRITTWHCGSSSAPARSATSAGNDADPSSAAGIRSRVSNNRYVSDHTSTDGGYRRYWGILTLG